LIWLVALGLLAQGFRQEYVRVTYYTLTGITTSGDYTRRGVLACSDWISLDTELVFDDGFSGRCLDRGLGGKYWAAWVDVWVPDDYTGRVEVQQNYGDYTWVTFGSD